MKPVLHLFAYIFSLTLFAAPLAAQQSVQDFSLPPGETPAPTPEVAGPADETAGVAIPPRRITTPIPSPAQTPAPATAQPIIQPIPAPGPAPETVQPTAAPPPSSRPSVATTATPEQTPLPSPASSSDDTSQSEDPSTTSIIPPAEPAVASTVQLEPVASDKGPSPLDWWPWIAGLFGALLAGGAGGWVFARRRVRAAPSPIKPPITPMPPNPSDGVGRLRGDKLKVSVDVERLMRSVMMLTLKFDVQLANRQEHALRDIRMSAELISARRGLSMEQQTASAGSSLQRIGQAARIGPNQTGTIRGQLQMPIGDFEVFRQGQIPFCVPILLLRLEAEGIEPQHHTFLIGLAPTQPGGRVQPLPLSGPPGGYDGVIAKRLERTS